jgi:hypothetical protein
MFDNEETEVKAEKTDCASKVREVVQSSSSVDSNAGVHEKPEVVFKESQRVAEEHCLSDNETSATEGPVEKTGATVDAPVVFGQKETGIKEGSLVLRRTEVVSKETEISFRECATSQKAPDLPLVLKDVGTHASEGSIVFMEMKATTKETKVLFKGKKSDPVGIPEAAVPYSETRRTTMSTSIPYRETEGDTTDAPVLILDEEDDDTNATAIFSEPEETTRNVPVVFIDTERSMNTPGPFSTDEEPPSRKIFPAVKSRIVTSYRQVTEAFQHVSTMLSLATAVNRPHVRPTTSNRAAAEMSPRNRNDTSSEARDVSQIPGADRQSTASFRRCLTGAVCPCSLL